MVSAIQHDNTHKINRKTPLGSTVQQGHFAEDAGRRHVLVL